MPRIAGVANFEPTPAPAILILKAASRTRAPRYVVSSSLEVGELLTLQRLMVPILWFGWSYNYLEKPSASLLSCFWCEIRRMLRPHERGR